MRSVQHCSAAQLSHFTKHCTGLPGTHFQHSLSCGLLQGPCKGRGSFPSAACVVDSSLQLRQRLQSALLQGCHCR